VASVNLHDGLKDVKKFCPESFDKILLDPPCSALGLRPKLHVVHKNLHDLEKHALYQRKFIDQAVKLLKPGGYMTYSTCTMNSTENEGVVKYVLQEYQSMELIALENAAIAGLGLLGRPGLDGYGLNEKQKMMVRRFDPGYGEADTTGFFVALFHRKCL
jgi:16S rRNA C967 or C1407 C5-methylase (RsmB/RsmF family)